MTAIIRAAAVAAFGPVGRGRIGPEKVREGVNMTDVSSPMDGFEVTWVHTLSVWWLVIWRLLVIGFFGGGFVGNAVIAGLTRSGRAPEFGESVAVIIQTVWLFFVSFQQDRIRGVRNCFRNYGHLVRRRSFNRPFQCVCSGTLKRDG